MGRKGPANLKQSHTGFDNVRSEPPMAIKKYKPTTPGRRGMTVTDYSVLSKVEPERSLLEPMKKHAGRNANGRITVRHHGGGNRTKYRRIDFKRNKFDVQAVVKTLEYDPNRSAHIALIEYADGEKAYITAAEGMKVGDKIMNGPNADIKPGNAMPFGSIPVGTVIHNIEMYPGKGAQLVRGAGTSAQLMAKEGKYALVRLPSGEIRNFRRALTFTHAGLGRLLGHRLIGEHLDPHLTTTLDVAGHGNTGSLNLVGGDPARLQSLDAVLALVHLVAAACLAFHAATLLAAKFYTLRH